MSARKLAWTLWALAPVAFLAWAFGPGAEARAREAAAEHLARARTAQAEERWEEAREALGQALAALPGSETALRQRLALEQADAALYAGELWPAVDAYEALLSELEPKGLPAAGADRALAELTRQQLASARYFAAWLMRLEGGGEADWRPEAAKARAHFALLAGRARAAELEEASASEKALAFEKNVEAVVRLELMDLAELEALPLPKNCPSCSGGLCKSKSVCKGGQCKGGKKPGDAREKLIQQGAGNLRAQGGGS